MSASYAWEKAYEALSPLVSSGSYESRLKAAGFALCQFPLDAVPPEVQRLALIACSAFTEYPECQPDGTISALIDVLPPNRKAELVEHVIRLFQCVCEFKGKADLDRRLDMGYSTIELGSPDCWEFLFWNIAASAPKEERDAYARYASHWLPNFPSEVLFEWIGRHGYQSLNTWGHLGLKELTFEEVAWGGAQLSSIQALHPDFTEVGPNSQGEYHLNRKGDWLGQFIRENGTWPAPIIVLHNEIAHRGLAGDAIPAGYVLIEGHKRLCRLLNQPAHMRQSRHRVWVAKTTQFPQEDK